MLPKLYLIITNSLSRLAFLSVGVLVLLLSCTDASDMESNFEFPSEAKTKIVAHRGVWNVSGSCENSIMSISLAEPLQIWGSEFDIHQTKDGIWVLNHDNNYNGLVIRDTDYTTLSKTPLSNGEQIPRFDNVIDLALNEPLSCSLMIEVKEGNIQELLPLIHELPDNQYCAISFSTEICEELINCGIHPVYLLLNDINEYPIEYYKNNHYDGVSVLYESIMHNKSEIAKFHEADLIVAAWTVNDFDIMADLLESGIDYIVTDCAERITFSSGQK